MIVNLGDLPGPKRFRKEPFMESPIFRIESDPSVDLIQQIARGNSQNDSIILNSNRNVINSDSRNVENNQ